MTINLRGAGAEGGGAGEDGFSPVPGGVANSVGIKLGPEPQNIWEDETIPYNIDGEALTAMDNELYEPLHFFDEDQRDVMIDVINDKVRRILRMDPSKWKHGKLPFGLRDETVRQYVEQMGGGPDEDLEETVANLKDELEMLKAVIRRKDFQIQKGENLLKRLKESGQIASTLEDPFKDDGGDAGGGLGAADGGGGAPPRRRGMIEQPPAEDDDDGGGGRGFTALELKEQVNKAVKPYQETINDLKQQLTDLRAELAKKAAQKPTPEQPKPRRRNRRGPGDDGEGDDDDCDDDGDDNDVGEGEEPGPNGRRRRRKKPTEPAPDPPPAPAPIPDRPDPSGPGGRRPPVTGDGTEPGPAPPPPDLPAPAGPDRELVRANDTLKASVEALVKMGDQLKDLRKFTFRALSAVGASQMLKPDVSGERRVEELMRECKAHGDQRAAWADGIRKVPSTDIALPQAIARDLTEMSGTGGASGAKAREYDAALRKWCEAVLANLKAPQAPAPKPKPTPVEEPEPVPAPAPAPVDPPPPSGPSPAELENAKLKEKNKKQQEELAKLLLTIDELRTRLEALPAAAAEVGPGAVEVVDAAMGRVRLKDLTRQLAPPKLKGVFERLYTDAVQRIQRYNLIQDQVVLANKIFVAAANAIAGNEEAGELPDLERLNATAQAALRGMWYHTDHMFKSLQEYAVSKGMDATSASMRAAKPSIEEMMEAALDEDFDDVLDLDEGPRPRPAGRRSDRAPKYPGAVGNRAFWNPLPGGVGPPPKSPRDLRNKILQDPEPTPFTAYVAQLKEARGDMGRDEWRRAAAAKPDRIKPASANKKLDALLAFPRKPPAASGLSGSQSLPALPKGRNHYQANDLDA